MAPSADLDLSSIPAPSKEYSGKKNLVLDMGNVLFKWDHGAAASGPGLASFVNPKLFQHMLQDSIWNEYETGKLTTEQAYDKLSQKFGVLADNIRSAVAIALGGFTPIPEIISIVNEYRGKLRLFCMTNVPAREFDHIYKQFPEIWQNFERVFTSADAGMRKPNLAFFQHVLHEAGINPTETVFVDDSIQNCVAAQSLGITAILCERTESAVQGLNFALRSEKERLSAAKRYLDWVLELHRQDLDSVSNNGARLTDNFSQFCIVEVLDDARFLPDLPVPENGELCYTRDTDMYNWVLFPLPNDLDTTAIGMTVWYAHGKVSHEFINSVVDNMLQYVSEDGILQTYFDDSRPRTCHVVLANVMLLFHVAGRRPPAASVEFLYNVLLNRAYLDGSQYYIGSISFLYVLSRTAAKFRDDHFLPKDFIPLLTARVQEAMGTHARSDDHLAVAMTILACLNLRMDPDVRDVEKLSRAQNADGSWDMCYWLKGNVLLFGCKAMTTAFALSALQRVHGLKS